MKTLTDFMWNNTLLKPPPTDVWFMGKYPADEVMPTFLRHDGLCLSVRWNGADLQVIHHKIALPAEWRP